MIKKILIITGSVIGGLLLLLAIIGSFVQPESPKIPETSVSAPTKTAPLCSDLNEFIEVRNRLDTPETVTVANTHPECDADIVALELHLLAAPTMKEADIDWSYLTSIPAQKLQSIAIADFGDISRMQCPSDSIVDCRVPIFGSRVDSGMYRWEVRLANAVPTLSQP